LAWKSTPVRKTGGISAAALGLLVCASAHTTPAAALDAADILQAGTPLSRYRDAGVFVSALAPRIVNLTEVRGPAADSVHASSAGEVAQPTVAATLHLDSGSSLALSSDRASQPGTGVLLRNSDALVRAKVRLPLGREWVGYVYADLGAVDSSFRWQGMAGIRASHGVDLIGGWRRVTYHFSPGMGCDSLDFNGPFLGATLAW
jgi:hypothetical protein